MNTQLAIPTTTKSHLEQLSDFIQSSRTWPKLVNWNSLVLEHPLTVNHWLMVKGLIDSYYNYGQECIRFTTDQEPGYLDNSLFTFRNYLDHFWESIVLDEYCCYAHNLILEFIAYINCRMNGVMGEYLEYATNLAKLNQVNTESWNINQYFDYYIKQFSPLGGLSQSRFGYILEFYPFNCIREVCKPKHYAACQKLFIIQEVVQLIHKLHLRNDSEVKINVAGFDFLSKQDLTPVMNKRINKTSSLDFLNYTYDFEKIDETWIKESFNMELVEALFTQNEFALLLENPFETYFENLRYFLNDVLPEIANNRVILPFVKKANESFKLTQKTRLTSSKGQAPYLEYFEEKLVFGYLLSDDCNQEQASHILRLLALSKNKGFDEVVTLLYLDQTKSSKLTKQSVRYLYELYKEQYDELFELNVDKSDSVRTDSLENDLHESNTDYQGDDKDSEEAIVFTSKTDNRIVRKTPWSGIIDQGIFEFKSNYINFDAFKYSAVNRSFKEVERILKIAISIHRENDSILDAFKAILINPDLYGIGASLLKNKVTPFHENTSRIRAGDLEIKLSEGYRLFLRNCDGDVRKVEIVELSNPKYHH